VLTRRPLAHRAARGITCVFHASTSCPLRRPLLRLFLSLVDVFAAERLAALLLYFSRRCLAHRTAHCIACFSLFSTFCLRDHLLHHLFLSLVDGFAITPRAAVHRSFYSLRTRCSARDEIHGAPLRARHPAGCLARNRTLGARQGDGMPGARRDARYVTTERVGGRPVNLNVHWRPRI
jgi:hypothetical protein